MSEMHPANQHPVRLLANDDLRRSRLTVFFRLLLVIPHVIVLAVWAIFAYVAVFLAWLIGIFLGRVPDGLHSFIASFLRYSTRVSAYFGLLANPFPPFGSGGSYPVDVEIDPAAPQGRLSIFFRIILAIPALILVYVFRIGTNIVALLGWFAGVILGRMPAGLEGFGTYCLRYETQTYGYLMLLTNRYPSLGGIS